MIEKKFEEAFTPEWVRNNIADQANDPAALRKIIPWQKIMNRLTPFYNDAKGRVGVSLRTVVALLIVGRLRMLSDREVVIQVMENRYPQYFRNVLDRELRTFTHHSSLGRIRRRLGEEGIAVIGSEICERLRSAGVIKGDSMLTDSAVLPGNIAYPTDIGLICDAFGKMRQFAERHNISIWWDEDEVKSLRREYNMSRSRNKAGEHLSEFAIIFSDVLRIFGERAADITEPEHEYFHVDRKSGQSLFRQHWPHIRCGYKENCIMRSIPFENL